MFLMLGINKEWLAKNLVTDQSVMEASLDARVRRASISSFMKYLSNQMLNVDDKIEENLNLDIVGCDSQTIERLKYSDLNTPIKVNLEGELSIIFHDKKSRDITLIAGALCDSFAVKKTIKYKLKTKVYLQCSIDINNEFFIKENVSSLVSVNDMNDLVFNEKKLTLQIGFGIRSFEFPFYVSNIDGKYYSCNCWSDFLSKLLTNSIPEELLKSAHPPTFWVKSLEHVQELVDNPIDSLCHLCAIENNPEHMIPVIRNSGIGYLYKEIVHFQQSSNEMISNIRRNYSYLVYSKWVSQKKIFLMINDLLPSDCKILVEASPSWLGRQKLDIFIPEMNLAVEYQGEQHFKSLKHWGGQQKLNRNKVMDERKKKLCAENGIKLVYFDCYEKLTSDLVSLKLQAVLQGLEDPLIKTPIHHHFSLSLEETTKHL